MLLLRKFKEVLNFTSSSPRFGNTLLAPHGISGTTEGREVLLDLLPPLLSVVLYHHQGALAKRRNPASGIALAPRDTPALCGTQSFVGKKVKTLDWDADGTPGHGGSRWDATPGHSDATPGRWDTTPTPGRLGVEPTPRRNRWDETPTPGRVDETPAWIGETPTAQTTVSMTPTPAKRSRSRWDETPAGPSQTPKAQATPVVGATPVVTAGLGMGVTPMGVPGMETPTPRALPKVLLTPEQYQQMRWDREIEERDRPLADDEVDSMLPGEKEGYKILDPPQGYLPIRTRARKVTATPTLRWGCPTIQHSRRQCIGEI
ncbi:LOW QUALITY PROTEIN: hypothetical protein BSKO_02355 [Bryopsis sp. KO-2023]|nr:LOW QUALITY PROTEIN: hypothetical protein BSKO_02355 [Bryopsis sp. KO-2023]